MRDSLHMLIDGLLAKLAVLTLALSLVVALGSNPVLMQRHMVNTAATHSVMASDSSAVAHEPAPAISGGFCVKMAPCVAIISQAPEPRVVGIVVARIAPATLQLTDGRALAPPLHPPIV